MKRGYYLNAPVICAECDVQLMAVIETTEGRKVRYLKHENYGTGCSETGAEYYLPEGLLTRRSTILEKFLPEGSSVERLS